MPLLRRELWSFVEKNIHHCWTEEIETGDCWIAVSLAHLSGLILCARVGKHTHELAQELVSSTEAKTDCSEWHTDGWGGYERALCSDEIEHYISKALTQRVELSQRHCAAAFLDDGIGDKTSSVSCGTRRKSPYAWSSATLIGFGGIRAWELQLLNEQS